MAKMYFYYSSMNAGKSTDLLRAVNNYEERKKNVEIYTAAVDDRYGVGKVTSRLGIQRDARTFDENFSFMKGVQKTDAVFIDEGQFLTKEQVRELHMLAQVTDTPVLVFGLRTDFQGKPFEGSSYLLALAEELHEIKTICDCESKATMNMRVDSSGARVNEGEQIAIGGNDKYRSVCGCCFYKNAA